MMEKISKIDNIKLVEDIIVQSLENDKVTINKYENTTGHEKFRGIYYYIDIKFKSTSEHPRYLAIFNDKVAFTNLSYFDENDIRERLISDKKIYKKYKKQLDDKCNRIDNDSLILLKKELSKKANIEYLEDKDLIGKFNKILNLIFEQEKIKNTVDFKEKGNYYEVNSKKLSFSLYKNHYIVTKSSDSYFGTKDADKMVYYIKSDAYDKFAKEIDDIIKKEKMKDTNETIESFAKEYDVSRQLKISTITDDEDIEDRAFETSKMINS